TSRRLERGEATSICLEINSMPSNYASNVVRCKLADLVDSPPEAILGVAVFEHLSDMYAGQECWVHSEWEFRTFGPSGNNFALVPQLTVDGVGRVDFAIFDPEISTDRPLVVVECDGHDCHSSPDQVTNDNRRDRTLLKLGIPPLRFTATDILRGSDSVAREIVEFVHGRINQYVARKNALSRAFQNGMLMG